MADRPSRSITDSVEAEKVCRSIIASMRNMSKELEKKNISPANQTYFASLLKAYALELADVAEWCLNLED